MLDSLKKALYTGLGLALLTGDSIKKMGKEIADKSNLSEEEGKKLVDEMIKRSEEAKTGLKAQVRKYVDETVTKLNLASKEEVEDLKKRISKLEMKKKSAK